jgi:DNA-damage-inducible protein J
VQVNIRVDDDVKNEADRLFNQLGLSLSTAVNLFLRQALREGGLPFRVQIGSDADPYYSDANLRYLERSRSELDAGRVVVKTIEELDQMARA